MLDTYLNPALTILAGLLLLAIGCSLAAIVILFIIDITQTKSTIRRNYPVLARFRYLFEHLGEFFRQYFFSMDREELPFNRAQRSWVYRAAKGVTTNIAFGSTRYHQQIIHDVNMIAHSCGVASASDLRPEHVRVVGHDGRSTPLTAIY